MEDYISNIDKHVESELKDYKTYMDLSKKAEDNGEPNVAAFFRDMAKEEFCHSKRWIDVMNSMGSVDLSMIDKCEKMINEAKKEIHNI